MVARFWCGLAYEAGCPVRFMTALCVILGAPPYRGELIQILASAYGELQKWSNPDRLLAAVLQKSHTLASDLGHSIVEPLHVFAALVGEARGPVSEVLRGCQVTYEQLLAALKLRFEAGKPVPDSGLPLSRGVEDWLLAQVGRLASTRDVVVDVATMLVDFIDARQVQQFLFDLGVGAGLVRAALLNARGKT